MQNNLSSLTDLFIISFRHLSTLIYGLLVFLLVSACENSNSSTTNEQSTADTTAQENTSTPTDDVAPAPFTAKDLLYTWVDKLNIRKSPDLESKVITTIDKDEAVEVIGEKSQSQSTYVLRGVAYVDHWYKIKTKGGDEGWVFGGALKRKNEQKGNAPITEEQFEFPYFGSFDLSTWKNLGTSYPEAEEIDLEVKTYEKADQILEITKADRGEFYYGYTYKLMDTKKNLLKQRDFNFSVDTDTQHTLSEKVQDFTTNPARVYSRSQSLNKSFYQLNSRPVMVSGAWQTSNLTKSAQ